MAFRSASALAACLFLQLSGAGHSSPAYALNPSRRLEQLKRTRWTLEDGLPPDIRDIVQGTDGYLWLGFADGLYRFDGREFERLDRDINPDRVPATALLAQHDGSLWVGYEDGRVYVRRNGRFRQTLPAARRSQPIDFIEDRAGRPWLSFGRPDRGMARFDNGRWHLFDKHDGLPEDFVFSMAQAGDGALWVALMHSVVVLRTGRATFEKTTIVPHGPSALATDRHGRVWMSDDRGSRVISGSARAHLWPTPNALRKPETMFDRDGNLWLANGTPGLFRLRATAIDGSDPDSAARPAIAKFSAPDSPPLRASPMIEDREGNLWVGSALEFDRLRATAVNMEPVLFGSAVYTDNLVRARDGSIYIGNDKGLYRVPPQGDPVLLATGVTGPLCATSDGAVWAVRDRDVLRIANGRTTSLPPPRMADVGVQDCVPDRHGRPWLLAGRDGLFQSSRAGWRYVPGSRDRPPEVGTVDSGGRLVLSSIGGGLERLDPPVRERFPLQRTAFLDRILTLYQGRSGLYIGSQRTFARLVGNRLQVLRGAVPRYLTGVRGIAETRAGETWLFGDHGLARMPTADLEARFSNAYAAIHTSFLDLQDGLPNLVAGSAQHAIVAGGDGRLWLTTRVGTAWVDPARMPHNALPPPVAIGSLTAGSKRYLDPVRIDLPPGSSSLEIGFTALSLTMPERNRFRYRLEGVDQDWVDPGSRRSAFYTNVGPGRYRFRVIASNNDGVWNRTGATLDFTVAPTFVQSVWFTILCVLLATVTLWILYTLRLRSVTGRMRMRLEARLAERERIARELHDTLLQGFQGLMLRFQSVAERLPVDLPARRLLDQALGRADEVLAEGRDRVRALRVVGREDLAGRVARPTYDYEGHGSASFKVSVRGDAKSLNPMVLEEAAAIGEEAVRNAFRHADAAHIEAEIFFNYSELRLRVADDGKGLDDDRPRIDRPSSRFGLVGMNERAVRIGGSLSVVSRSGAGTEVTLSVPGRLAYRSEGRSRWWRWQSGLAEDTT